jgi:hypothetical protein
VSWRLAFGLFAFALIARIPFATTNLYAPDSVLFARAIDRFDPFEQRPQPPGYLWYVLLVRAIDLATGDPNRAMTIVSAVAGASTVALVYLLGARLYEERTGRVAAILTMTSVTFWAYGGVAYGYTLLAALTTLCALLFWRAHDDLVAPGTRGLRLIVASAAYGISVGFRSDLAIFLAPLWLLTAIRATVSTAVVAAAAVTALVLAWIGASGIADGGVGRFLTAVSEQSRFVDERYSVFGNGPIAIYRNSYELARFLGRGLYFLLPLIAVALLSAEARRAELRDRWRTAFLLIWTFAPLPFYVFIHVGEYGYIFSMLPGLAIIAARGAVALAKGLRRPRLFPWIVGAVALANAAIFLFSDTPISEHDIVRQDRGIDEKLAYLTANLAPATTVVVTAYDAVLVDHYLAHRYAVLAYDPAGTPSFSRPLVCDAALAPCAESEASVVLWDDLLRAEGTGWTERILAHGGRLRIQQAPRTATLRVSDGLGVQIVH